MFRFSGIGHFFGSQNFGQLEGVVYFIGAVDVAFAQINKCIGNSCRKLVFEKPTVVVRNIGICVYIFFVIFCISEAYHGIVCLGVLVEYCPVVEQSGNVGLCIFHIGFGG